ncbi:MAG TPA: M1 family metallopeptidase [Gammaproteobacteria bacterium]|nr:M1 family metallopeptidase [Gammaproteobacteria bacterium]
MSRPPEPAVERIAEAAADPHSFSNPHALRVSHLELELDVDFAQRVLNGTAVLDIERVDSRATRLVLDTRALDVTSTEARIPDAGWRRVDFELGEEVEFLGRPLVVDFPAGARAVRVRYRTAPEASGLQWLTPEQTAAGAHPFLFTQSQAIHARSWIPLQDTPGVRMTYAATVRTPPGMLAVMSAKNDPGDARDGVYRFEMPQPIPAYLIALGVGHLAFEPMGARTGVYAEPPVVAAAAAEFSDTERMLEITERLFGPYRWGRYDLLILPPSFPFGGMENPRLSFITPTVIAGDKSLVALIAHELAHSWSGNLVTNATWRDLWLNEGFTVYVESRIMESVYGLERRNMEDALGLHSLREELAELDDPDEILAIELRGRDPDDVFTDVPYEKGRLFLVWLEDRFGRDRFDRFLRGYFDRFAFESITTEQFLAYLEAELLESHPGTVTMAAVRAWVYEPGLPAEAVLPQSDAFDVIDAARERWLDGRIAAGDIDTSVWTVHEWLRFLEELPDELDRERLAALDAAFALTPSSNAEIASTWLEIAIRNQYRPAYARLEEFLVGIGRRKLIEDLYKALVETGDGREFALRVYARAKPGYHPLMIATAEKILFPKNHQEP